MANEQFRLVVHLELTDESKDLIRKKEEKAALAIKELLDAAQAAKFKVKVVKEALGCTPNDLFPSPKEMA